jgi:hypothetical protein
MTMSCSTWRSAYTTAALALSIPAAQAIPVDYQIDFSYNPGQSCIRSFCFPLDPLPGYAGSFSVDSAAAASGGWIDIAATVSLGQLHRYDGVVGATQAYTARVDFVAGAPVDLALQYSGSYSVVTPPPFSATNSGSYSFQAGGGSWSQTESVYYSPLNYASTNSASGHYTISAIPLTVPEPASGTLLVGGLLALAALGGRSRHFRDAAGFVKA